MNINWDLNINPNNSGLWNMKKTQPYHVTPGQEKSAQDDHVAHKTKTVFFKAPRLGLGKKHETTMHTYRTLLKYWNQGVVELMMFLILGSYCINDTYIYIHYCVYIYILLCFSHDTEFYMYVGVGKPPLRWWTPLLSSKWLVMKSCSNAWWRLSQIPKFQELSRTAWHNIISQLEIHSNMTE